ncbi:uncharacterized protein BJ212DRAFT_1377561 [Suillus subaureus]|uniref:Uncharacterized protein n=1 Tax=Suillus subaureus TaxID=48587 RepID=A0A9P7J9V3_9AGAM|nr:uncharacterized protein BJ212DRAFT_1377561 [Suillus subaureus]KAG1810575.1 hypothetical protein BJ212DRAFT_1377561 [Suillus subaureus]
MYLSTVAPGNICDSFELYANAYERSVLLRDFYGKEVALFSQTQGSEPEKVNARKGFPGVLEGLEGERRKTQNLTTIFNNSDKDVLIHAIVHAGSEWYGWRKSHSINTSPTVRPQLGRGIMRNTRSDIQRHGGERDSESARTYT